MHPCSHVRGKNACLSLISLSLAFPAFVVECVCVFAVPLLALLLSTLADYSCSKQPMTHCMSENFYAELPSFSVEGNKKQLHFRQWWELSITKPVTFKLLFAFLGSVYLPSSLITLEIKEDVIISLLFL